jgi:membrane protein YqaA with SNARE-associated domain
MVGSTTTAFAAAALSENSHPISQPDVPPYAQQALIAALVLAVGCSLGGYVLFLIGVPVTVLAFILAMRAAVNWSSPERARSFPAITAWLVAMAALGFVGPSGSRRSAGLEHRSQEIRDDVR